MLGEVSYIPVATQMWETQGEGKWSQLELSTLATCESKSGENSLELSCPWHSFQSQKNFPQHEFLSFPEKVSLKDSSWSYEFNYLKKKCCLLTIVLYPVSKGQICQRFYILPTLNVCLQMLNNYHWVFNTYGGNNFSLLEIFVSDSFCLNPLRNVIFSETGWPHLTKIVQETGKVQSPSF